MGHVYFFCNARPELDNDGIIHVNMYDLKCAGCFDKIFSFMVSFSVPYNDCN